MAGETYGQEWRLGVETTYSTPAVPTRRAYLTPDSGMQPGGSVIRNELVTGHRAQFVSARPGAEAPGGSFTLPLMAGEILEWLRIGLASTPVITTPGGTTPRLHTYTGPGTSLASATVQWSDGARPWQMTGVYADNLRVTFNASPDGDAQLTGDLFGNAITQTALTGSPTARSPLRHAGWETQLWIDPETGTDNYGTTLIACGQSITEADLPLAENALARVYTACNTRSAQAATIGRFEASGSMLFLASGAQALTNYNDFKAGTTKRIRVRFGDNVTIETTFRHFVDIDIPIVWTEFDLLGEVANVRLYRCSFAYLYDSTNSLGLRVRCQTDRVAAF